MRTMSAAPVEVHVDRNGGRGRVIGEALLQLHHFGQVEAGATVFLREGGVQVARLP
jgi:hypothetical protein